MPTDSINRLGDNMINKIKNYLFNENKISDESKNITQENWKRTYSLFLENLGDDTQHNIILSINEKISELKNIGNGFLIENMSKDANERMRKLLESDREIYVRILKNFCDSITIRTDAKVLYFEELFTEFMTKLKKFTKETEEIYPQLKEYYPTHIQNIMKSLKEIHTNYNLLEESTKTGLMKSFNELKKDTESYFEDIAEERKYKDIIASANFELSDIEKKIKIIEEKKNSLKLLKEYSSVKESYEEKERIELEIGKNKEELCELIFSISDVLEDYKKRNDADKKLVQRYIDDPASALLWDSTFEINKILGDLKFDINLKDPSVKKKQQRVTTAVDKILKKSYLSSWITKYNSLQKSKKVADDKMKNNKVVMDLSELDYQMNHLKDRINKKHALIKSCQESLDSLYLAEKKHNIEEKAKSVLRKRITIL